MLQLLGSLRGLRVQLLLWTVLPLTFVLVAVAVIGINTHQRSMREMVEELDARSARLAAAHLSGSLAERAAWLQTMAAGRSLTPDDTVDTFFDGGLARFDAAGQVVEALPSVEAWRDRPISQVLAAQSQRSRHSEADDSLLNPVVFSSIFIDPHSGRDSLLLGLTSEAGDLFVGTVSMGRLGLTEAVVQTRSTSEQSPDELREGDNLSNNYNLTTDGAIAFLVDAEGRIIYHPNSCLNMKA